MSRSSHPATNPPKGVPPPVASPPQTPDIYPQSRMPGITEKSSSARPIFAQHASQFGLAQKLAFQRPQFSSSQFTTAFSSSLPEPNTIFPSTILGLDTSSPQPLRRPAQSPFEFDEPYSWNSANPEDGHAGRFSRNRNLRHPNPQQRHRNLSQPRFTPSTGSSYPGNRTPFKISTPTVTVVESFCGIELEEIGSDFDPVLDNCEITILRPSSIEECVDPDYSHPRSRHAFVERDVISGMSNLNVGRSYESDSDLEEPEVRDFVKRQREIKRQTRMSHGSSIGKRPFSDRDDPDIEDLRSQYREGTVFSESGFLGDRRIRRRVGERRPGSTADPQPERIPELEEPDTDDEDKHYDYSLDCELPYHGWEIMEVQSDDEDFENENDNGVLLYP
ncbi:hypothetical protein HOO65_080248 [Ceratocystis lukuohia]